VFISAPGVVKVVMTYLQAGGEIAENVFHVGDPGQLETADVPAPDLTTIATNFADWFDPTFAGTWTPANPLKGFMTNQGQLASVTAKSLFSVNGPSVTVAVGLSGGVSVEPLPNGLTFTVTMRTGLTGRSFRGRWYVPLLCNNGATTATSMNLIQLADANGLASTTMDMVNQLASISVPSLSSLRMVVLSYVNKDAVPTPPHLRSSGLATEVISTGYHDLYMDYQRRRAPGHNRHH
jgi:hypothetical protein